MPREEVPSTRKPWLQNLLGPNFDCKPHRGACLYVESYVYQQYGPIIHDIDCMSYDFPCTKHYKPYIIYTTYYIPYTIYHISIYIINHILNPIYYIPNIIYHIMYNRLYTIYDQPIPYTLYHKLYTTYYIPFLIYQSIYIYILYTIYHML